MTNAYRVSAMMLVLSLAWSSQAFAGPQQEKMKTCNAEAKEKALKGDERKAFMKTCLSANGGVEPVAAGATQQEKMKACNAEAKHKALKGDERKQFMSDCLKGS